MYQRISEYDFYQAFHDMGRADQFSREALDLLFEYLEQYEEDTGQPYELDVIALCCEFAEDAVEDIAENYSIDLTDALDEDEQRGVVREYLEENTFIVGETDDGFVYQSF